MKKMVVLILLLSGMGFAQRTTIKGSDHPELIPDSAAFQCILNVHLQSDVGTASRDMIGLSPTDRAIYDAALNNVISVNKANAASTLASLSRSMTPTGYSTLLAHIQARKAFMVHVSGKAVRQ
jgi:hypothetical protein